MGNEYENFLYIYKYVRKEYASFIVLITGIFLFFFISQINIYIFYFSQYLIYLGFAGLLSKYNLGISGIKTMFILFCYMVLSFIIETIIFNNIFAHGNYETSIILTFSVHLFTTIYVFLISIFFNMFICGGLTLIFRIILEITTRFWSWVTEKPVKIQVQQGMEDLLREDIKKKYIFYFVQLSIANGILYLFLINNDISINVTRIDAYIFIISFFSYISYIFFQLEDSNIYINNKKIGLNILYKIFSISYIFSIFYLMNTISLLIDKSLMIYNFILTVNLIFTFTSSYLLSRRFPLNMMI